MAPTASCIPCYYCKDEEEPVPLYDSKSFTAHLLEKHREQVGPVIVPEQVGPVIVTDPVDVIFGDSFGLSALFFEDEAEDDAASASADAGTIARSCYVCDSCPETFNDLSSSTNHLRIVHPDLFYPVCAHVAVSASGSASAPLAAESAGSASAPLAVESSAGEASGSGSASAEVDEDDCYQFLRFP